MFENYVGKFEQNILKNINFYIEPICLANKNSNVKKKPKLHKFIIFKFYSNSSVFGTNLDFCTLTLPTFCNWNFRPE